MTPETTAPSAEWRGRIALALLIGRPPCKRYLAVDAYGAIYAYTEIILKLPNPRMNLAWVWSWPGIEIHDSPSLILDKSNGCLWKGVLDWDKWLYDTEQNKPLYFTMAPARKDADDCV